MISGIRQVHPPVSSSQQLAGKPALTGTPAPSSVAGDKTSNPLETAAKTVNALQSDESERASLDKVVEELNRNVQRTTRTLVFTVDERQGKPIVSVVDKETDKVIRQIPSEVALQVADALDEVTGALVSEHA
jgi:flagellar protein FlaG